MSNSSLISYTGITERFVTQLDGLLKSYVCDKVLVKLLNDRVEHEYELAGYNIAYYKAAYRAGLYVFEEVIGVHGCAQNEINTMELTRMYSNIFKHGYKIAQNCDKAESRDLRKRSAGQVS